MNPLKKKIVKALEERDPNIHIVNLQEGLDLLSGDDATELTPCLGHARHAGRDLHTWLSTKLALKQSQMIADTLIALFPEHKESYQKNFNQLALDLQFLDRDLARLLAPYKGDAILVSHPALGYFCKDYDLIQLSIECEGKEPGPKDIEQILQKTEIYHVRCVLLQKGFSERGAMRIGTKLQLPIYRIDPYAKDYLKNMQQIAGYIAQ